MLVLKAWQISSFYSLVYYNQSKDTDVYFTQLIGFSYWFLSNFKYNIFILHKPSVHIERKYTHAYRQCHTRPKNFSNIFSNYKMIMLCMQFDLMLIYIIKVFCIEKRRYLKKRILVGFIVIEIN